MPISLSHCKNSRKQQSFISTTYIAFHYTISLIHFGMSSVLCPDAGAAHTIAKARPGICRYLFSDFHTNSEGPRDSAVSYLSELQPLGTVSAGQGEPQHRRPEETADHLQQHTRSYLQRPFRLTQFPLTTHRQNT